MLLFADIYHHQALLDQTETHVVLGVPKLYCDERAGGALVLHVQQALGVLDVLHNAVHHVRTGILLKRQGLIRRGGRGGEEEDRKWGSNGW